MPATSRIIAGAMSGTSADGVDVALVQITGRGLEMTAKLIRHHHIAYPRELREEIFCFRNETVTKNTLGRLAELGRQISLAYATAVNEALAASNMTADQLAAVAAHGQTLFHDPPNTIQWFDPSLVAWKVGCPVVSDFRRADLAADGQGAPLVPFADYILFRHPTENRVLLNIGGIANFTYLKAGGSLEDVLAMDTGPGNCISDHLCRKYFPDGPGYDENGAHAMQGTIHVGLAKLVLIAPYFNQRPPKSTDGPQMIQLFEEAVEGLSLSIDDQIATAASITTASILGQIEAMGDVDRILVSGGGVRNAFIFQQLTHAPAPVDLAEESSTKEAIAFALLGAATLDGVPSNVPSVTGAKHSVVLGSVTPKP